MSLPDPRRLPVRLRTMREEDLASVAAMNDAAVPAVNALGLDGLREHLPRCSAALVAHDASGVIGFLLALAPGADYASENYAWFSAHVPGSLYVDRIVVAPRAASRGVGRALYAAVTEQARALGLDRVTAEVNLEPPNPRSSAFHARLGFTPVGEQVTKGGTVRVELLALTL
ncbi:GNAT family N-acetyltransferase [Cellulomonas edaphi]|uniref:GNAT family N-acetyltransferase n=1 Tax=Cellulomonas edaphi TaxID=3053468 RepID=A0ABT7S8N4_9CELL|nr:GNAT family N-acetyltransferase [Cellulomons edaphi]MDM7831971.1 GNAT family N-acetyltransferase [Cellulomons edaphi]